MVEIDDTTYLYFLKLEQGVRTHRDQRGDDRCWMDDENLYKLLPEGYTAPKREVAVELELCKKYLQCRRNPATTYVSPQRRIEELSEKLYEIMKLANSEEGLRDHIANMDRIKNICQEAFNGYEKNKPEYTIGVDLASGTDKSHMVVVPKEQFGHFEDEK